MVLDLVIIGLAITLMPLTLLAFILILGTQQGLRKGWPSFSAGRPAWWW